MREISALRRLAQFVFVAFALETTFSVPYRSVYLASHSSLISWIAGFVGIACAGIAYRFRKPVLRAFINLFTFAVSFPFAMWIWIAIGTLLRVLWVLRFHPSLRSDGLAYFTEGANLAFHHNYSSAFWPPGFPLFLTPFIAVFGANYWVSVFCSLLLFAGTVILSCRLTALLVGETVGPIPAVLLAVWPGYITIAGINSKEMFLGVLVLGAMLCLYHAWQSQGSRLFFRVLCGILLGASCLVQPGMMLIPCAVYLAEVLVSRKPVLSIWRTAIVGIVMVLTILPWTVRNYVAYHRMILISTNGGSVFYRANNPKANASYAAEGEQVLPKDEDLADKEGYALAKQWIEAHPLDFAALAIRKQVVYLGDDGIGIYESLKRDQHPSHFLYNGLKAITSLYWMALWLLLICCIRAVFQGDWPKVYALTMFPLLYQWTIDSIFESGSRHHMAYTSFVVILIVYAISNQKTAEAIVIS